ncbi:MAG: hypothetical protein IJS65_03325 [Clostridia bacterium]|nr:hypothetical protein [Clostridia bacterium]
MKKLLLFILSALLLFSFSACGGMMDDGRFRKIVGKGGETYKVEYKELYDGVNALYMIDKKKRVVSVQIGAETDGSLETASLDYYEDGRLKQMNYSSAAVDVGYFCYYVYNGEAAPERYELYKDGDLLAKASLDFDGEIDGVILTEEGKGLIFMPYYNAKTETFSHVFFDENGEILPEIVRTERTPADDKNFEDLCRIDMFDVNGRIVLSERVYEGGKLLDCHKYVYDEKGLMIKDVFYLSGYLYNISYGYLYYISYFEYDESGRLTAETAYFSEGDLNYVRSYEYDENGDLAFENLYLGDGMPYNKYEYGKNGTLKKKIDYYYETENICCVTLYNDDGTISCETEYDNEGNITNQTYYDENVNPANNAN